MKKLSLKASLAALLLCMNLNAAPISSASDLVKAITSLKGKPLSFHDEVVPLILRDVDVLKQTGAANIKTLVLATSEVEVLVLKETPNFSMSMRIPEVGLDQTRGPTFFFTGPRNMNEQQIVAEVQTIINESLNIPPSARQAIMNDLFGNLRVGNSRGALVNGQEVNAISGAVERARLTPDVIESINYIGRSSDDTVLF